MIDVVWGGGKLFPLSEVCLLREYVNFYEQRERWQLSILSFYKVSHYSHISEIKSAAKSLIDFREFLILLVSERTKKAKNFS